MARGLSEYASPMPVSKYLKDVLGVKKIYGADVVDKPQSQYWNEQGYFDLNLLNENTKVLFVHRVASDSMFSPPVLEMFQKMTQAMKLDSDSFQVCETSLQLPEVFKNIEGLNSMPILVWFEKEGQVPVPARAGNIFVVASPVEMNKKPELKKQAWEILKRVMQVVQK